MKETQDDELNGRVDELLEPLLGDFKELNDLIDKEKRSAESLSSNRSLETLAKLINSRNKLGKLIIEFYKLKGDPKFRNLKQASDKDIARIVKKIVELKQKESSLAIEKQQLMAFKGDSESRGKRSLIVKK